jgi:hypothetical protein
LGYFCNFQKTAQSKQSPKKRKIAKSAQHLVTEKEKKISGSIPAEG